MRVWTANAPSVPRLLIFPLKAAHRRDTASLFHCLLPRGHSRACLPIGKSPPLGPGAALMTESRSLPCSAPRHQSRGAAERHSPHATRSRLSRPSVDDKRALESDIHPPASGETNVLTDAAVLMRKPLRLLAAARSPPVEMAPRMCTSWWTLTRAALTPMTPSDGGYAAPRSPPRQEFFTDLCPACGGEEEGEAHGAVE